MVVTSSHAWSLWLLVVACAVVGCGEVSRDPKLPPLHPVSGQVMYRGQPAAGFRVIFHPVGDIGALKFSPAGITEADGTFKLRSYKPDDGAPPGEYIVCFEWPDHIISVDDPEPAPEVDKLRGAYSDPQRSTFKATVVEGANQVPVFNLN